MFGPKRLAPDTIAFAGSLRDPALSASKSPFETREYKKGAFPWAFMSSTSSLNCRLAIYSAALADLLIRADELEVSEEDAVTIRALILEVAAMQFAGAARMRVFALTQHRNLALDTMGLRDRLDVSAAVRTPKDGKFLFGGKLFEGVDTDLSMLKRVREVASQVAKPQRGDAFRRRCVLTPLFPPGAEDVPFELPGQVSAVRTRQRRCLWPRFSAGLPPRFRVVMTIREIVG